MATSQKKFEFILSVKEQGFTNFKKGEKGLEAFNKELKKGGGLLGDYSAKLVAVAGAFAGIAGIGAMNQMIQGVVAGGKELGNLSRIAGESVENFQASAYAARQMGIEQEQYANISKDTIEKLGDYIKSGGGEFADFFDNVAPKVGLTAEMLQGLSGKDVLIAVKKAMDDVNVSASEQVSYLEDIASESSLLIPLLKDNGKAFKEQAEAAKRLGLVISDMDAEQLKEVAEQVAIMDSAMTKLKTDIVIALAPAIKDFSEAVVENREEIADLVVNLAEAAGAVLQFALEHQDLIAFLAKTAIGLAVVTKAITVCRAAWAAMNAASLAMTGSQIIPHLAKMRVALLATASAAQLLGAALVIGLAGKQVMELGYQMNEARKASQHLKQSQEGLAATEAKAAAKLKLVEQQTGLTYNSVLDLAHAVHNGELHFDKATQTWVKGARQMKESAGDVAKATKESFDTQQKYSKEKLIAMAKAYKDFADKAKGYADEIADRERSLAEELREMSRSGMSDLGAWKDRKAEAEEYAKAARAAVAAGNYDEAIAMADKAKAAYADLNKEVKDGDNVAVSQQKALETAMAGVKDAGQIAIDALEAQKKAAEEAAETMDKKTGGQLSELAKKADEFDGSWEDAWKSMQKQAGKAIKEVDNSLDDMARDRHVNVYVNEVEANNTGGVAGRGVYRFAGGGTPMIFKRPSSPVVRGGAGRIDDVPAMLTRKEYIQPVPTVDYYGVDLMEVLRKRLINRDLLRQVMGLRHYNQGGMAVPAHMRVAPVHLNTGGLAGAAPSGGGGASLVIDKIEFNYTGSGNSQQDARKMADMVMSELKRRWLGSSA